MISKPDVYVDPAPVTPRLLSDDEMAVQVGGAVLVVVIVTCGGTLGSRAFITSGIVVATVVRD